MENKRDIKFNYALRLNRQLEAMQYNKKFWYVQSALTDLLEKKGIKSRFFIPELPEGEESFLSLREYNELQIAARLFTLVGKCPEEIKNYNIEFLCGIKTDTAPVEDNELIEEYEYEGFELVWLIIGQNEEIRMLAYVSESDGYVMPILDKEIESDYGGRDKENENPKFWGQYRGEEDGFEYISELYNFLYSPSDDYSYSLETDNYLTDQDDIDYEDRDDNADDNEEEEGEWTEDIEDDEEDEVEWIYPDEEYEDDDDEDDDEWSDEFEETDEEDDGSFEWDEIDLDDFKAADTDDETEETSELIDKYRKLNYIVKNIKVLSVTDMNGNERSAMEGAMYNNIQGFSGKIPEINVGERMCIFYPEPIIRPGSQMKIHTSPVMFHSEEFISKNEVKHIVRTANSIYTFIEYKKQH